MDTQIKVRNTKTGQECAFDTREAVDTFGANVEDRADWELADQAPAANEPVTLTDIVEPATLTDQPAA